MTKKYEFHVRKRNGKDTQFLYLACPITSLPFRSHVIKPDVWKIKTNKNRLMHTFYIGGTKMILI